MKCPKCGTELKSDNDCITGEDFYYCPNPKCDYESDLIGK